MVGAYWLEPSALPPSVSVSSGRFFLGANFKSVCPSSESAFQMEAIWFTVSPVDSCPAQQGSLGHSNLAGGAFRMQPETIESADDEPSARFSCELGWLRGWLRLNHRLGQSGSNLSGIVRFETQSQASLRSLTLVATVGLEREPGREALAKTVPSRFESGRDAVFFFRSWFRAPRPEWCSEGRNSRNCR